MITGIVAQESLPLPRGILVARLFFDSDTIFGSVLTSGSDQRAFPDAVVDTDEFFDVDMPYVLTAVYVDDTVVPAYSPLVARDHRFLAPLTISPDIIHLPDIRIPGTLQPQLVADIEAIFPTPLILDLGMLRAITTVYDDETIFPFTIDAALTIYHALVDDAANDAFYSPFVRSGGLIAPFLLSDDVIYNFSSLTRVHPTLVIDDGIPVQPPTRLDGEATVGVTLSADKMTAIHNAATNYDGVRSTLLKSSGKYYFEAICGPTHGPVDCIGVLQEDADYFDLANFSEHATAVYSRYMTTTGLRGVVVNDFTLYGTIGGLEEGEVVGVAIDIDNRRGWFRKKTVAGVVGDWNGNAASDPVTVSGGVPLPTRFISPVIGFGGQLGRPVLGDDVPSGLPGDNITVRFVQPYAMTPPPAYRDWIVESPFPPAVNGDSLGNAIVGLPARFDGFNAGATMSNGQLTVTHNTTVANAGARSLAVQTYGHYYFEITVGATHGASDCCGIMLEGADFVAIVTHGNGCAAIRPSGAIIGVLGPASIGSTYTAGDVISFAVDLANQDQYQGGYIWIRKNGESWNGDDLADPATGAGGLPLVGFNNLSRWIPCVGFGTGLIGDSFTANFGQSAFVRKAPSGYAIWSSVTDPHVQVVQPLRVNSDDSFLVPFIDLGLKVLYHPDTYVYDIEAIFPTTSFGGNLLLYAETLVDADVIHAPGYLATLDGIATASVTLSANRLTATVNSVASSFGARSTAQKSAGKYYFEATYGQKVDGGTNNAGVLTETGTYPNMNGFSNCTVISGDTVGRIYSNNGQTGRQLGKVLTGDVIGIAIDLDLRRAWLRRNGGDWNGVVGSDPAGGVGGGGVVMPALLSFAPALCFGSGVTVGDSISMNFGQAVYANPPPVGFQNWAGGSSSAYIVPSLEPSDDDIKPVNVSPANLFAGLVDDAATVEQVPLISMSGGNPTIGPQAPVQDDLLEVIHAPNIFNQLATFDGAVSAVTLSPDKLVATHNSTANNAGARSLALKSTGKCYFEVTYNSVHGDGDSCGILLSTGTLTNFVSNGTFCTAIYRWNGGVYSNNGFWGSIGACTTGDVISVAIDLAARKAWFRKNGGLWNGMGLTNQNPNTGLGGIVIQATGSFAPAVGFGGAGTAINDQMTANFGQTAFIYPPPIDFLKWGA